jgi:uncharacterized protein (TIGR02246 family)
MMRKILSLALLICIAVFLGPLALTAHSQTVEGTFEYTVETVYQEEAHGQKITYGLEHEWWTGTLDGTAHALFIVIANEAGIPTVDLFSTFTGTVDGKSGSLVIRLIGEKLSPKGDWAGDWDIVRGTGELKNLQGQGTWGGPGYEGPKPPEKNWDPTGEGNTRPDIWYKGTISTLEDTSANVILGTPSNLGPIVNSPSSELTPSISGDGLELYFGSDRPGGYGDSDIWVATRPTTDDKWGEAVNLGPVVNSSAAEGGPTISHDGLTLYFSDFNSPRPGGHGEVDLWVTTRATKDDPWEEPVNLGPTVNSPKNDVDGSISDDGLELYFMSNRSGGYGSYDLWFTTRATTEDDWGTPMNLGPTLNSSNSEHCPSISADGLTLFYDITVKTADGKRIGDLMVTQRATKDDDWGEPVNLGHAASDHFSPSLSADGSTLFFWADRPGGSGEFDIWQVPVFSMVPADAAFKATVEEVFTAYSAANMAGDADRYMSLWDEDCIKMGPGKPAVFGKAAIDKRKRAGYQKADVESQIINVEEARVAGEWGFARGTFTATEKSKKDGAVAHADGKFLTIFKKQVDGSWKIFRDCYNSN